MPVQSTVEEAPAHDDFASALETLLEPYALDRDDHLNAPAFVIRPDEVQDVLAILREEAGLDHCACVTAQQYEDRFETIYHLRSYDDPTREVSVVVPTPTGDPTSQSAAPIYETANWHEREAYDLVGIEYEDHPDLRRILLPETWQGHPLGLEYDQEKPQIVTLSEHENPIAGDDADPESETLFLNLGPHHPATHGVMHVKAVLDGETVVDAEPDIGYMHRCEEQMCQQGTYRHQIMPYPDRWDWVSAGLLNEWAYARTAEELAGLEVPEYARLIRTMGAELSRMAAHLISLGTYALDVYGEFTATFQYAMRDRELVLDILEDLTGQRMMFNYFRLGGVAWDLPEPRDEFFEQTRDVLDSLPAKIDEYHDLLVTNEIFQARCVDTGVLEPEVARQYGCTGPVARGSGIDYDLRRDDPYGYYPHLEWDVVTQSDGDNYSRALVRMGELEESAKIVEQCLDLLEEWPEDEREVQANVPRTLKPDADAEIYRAVEGAKGELGIYIRSDGSETPARFKIRSPSFSNLSVLPVITRGEYVPDLIASIGSLDCIMGEVDR
ncbi:NADH-quinone oxidoreductase subunit D [Natronobacterium texcoconense]|uniref:NADH dehydrogenase subunit C /NADH dehydrogenase subunit D n=1 Tax=Natronobacterium texcoconense TaxID=1095778 RepID=A0A1H1GR55_NATTX|nr:NADH-quinone oxidoreductase subunit D [Natronobacterium texcoconense]SDR15356.1 NADH dehydrogenase subunit C /NADH dehydrogenase subunit D [Natronobacterium texcoconense]